MLALLLLLIFYVALKARGRYLMVRARLAERVAAHAQLDEQNNRLIKEIEHRVEAERQLEYRANYDQLTGLPNRTLVLDRLSQALLRAERNRDRVVVLFLDLDHFKQVNDTLGHAAGDRLLQGVAQRLRDVVRDSDTVARLGGDEFLLLLSDLHEREGVEGVCEKILAALGQPFVIFGHEFHVSASIGIALYPDDGESAEVLLKSADIALYRVKEEGRCGYRFFSPSMNAQASERLLMESELHHGLEHREFFLVYQPVVELARRRIVGVEALLRWENPLLGVVSPERFVPVAEEIGLIRDIGAWVLRQALRDIGELQGLGALSVAVDVSGHQLKQGEAFVRMVEQCLHDSDMPPRRLLLELTEGLLLEDGPEMQRTLGQLKRLGCRLSLDDFGSGYSSLGYLKRFSFDQLKIDRIFVRDLRQDGGDTALVRAILAMGEAMDLPVVAEGVEQEFQATWLQQEKCRYAQGFLFSPGVLPAELICLLREPGVAWAEPGREVDHEREFS